MSAPTASSPDVDPAPYFRVLAEDADATRVEAGPSTAGPWFPDAQHMGPPSALLVRALERALPRDDVRLARLTVEVLGRVPLGELTVTAQVVRPGRTIELVHAEIAAGGRAVARAAGWFHGVVDTAGVATEPASAGSAGVLPAMPGPDGGSPRPRPEGWLPGYLDSVDWRWVDGGLDVPGPGRAWGRLRVPVVDTEEPTPVQRLAAIADSTNGVGARLDLTAWVFVNTDLTLHLFRPPAGGWTGLDADSVVGPDGSGTAFSVVHDAGGPVGRVAQALTVRPR